MGFGGFFFINVTSGGLLLLHVIEPKQSMTSLGLAITNYTSVEITKSISTKRKNEIFQTSKIKLLAEMGIFSKLILVEHYKMETPTPVSADIFGE